MLTRAEPNTPLPAASPERILREAVAKTRLAEGGSWKPPGTEMPTVQVPMSCGRSPVPTELRDSTVAQLGIEVSDYRNVMLAMGMQPRDSDHSVYEYRLGDGDPLITVHFDAGDPKNSKVAYTPLIKVEHRYIESFGKEENVVTLVCVADLLSKGYLPQHLVLEKTWQVGHKDKGRLDILIVRPGKAGKAPTKWAMVECKTWGQYVVEQNKMRAGRGQLFTYWLQDREADFMNLYSCCFRSGQVEARSEFIALDNLNRQANNSVELFESWDATFAVGGLFHPDALVYDSTERLIKKSELKTLDQETGTGIFNAFAELLRRHSVSDKGNAFNKMFNLFLCKVIDEDDHGDKDTVTFQVRGGGDPKQLLDDLDDLYRRGLNKYLGIKVVKEYVTGAQNFGFVEVFDEASFSENYRIVREAVRLLQSYKLKYSSKQQHLGDFFELLLNTGVKQESGQFFTPVPLTRFAVQSLPLETVVRQGLTQGAERLFPRVLDYACGSGHFITEAIDAIQQILNGVDQNSITNSRDREKFLRLRDGYQWTEGAVVGIERDHRLAKVTKIATFLNGDGDATILHADGLDSFYDSRVYTGLLKAAIDGPVESRSRNHPVFDVLVANPPYSVSNFRAGSAATDKSFSLLKHIATKGTEIECLFVERAAQILRPGGVSAIILPSGFFTAEKSAYNEARKLLLRSFRVHAIVNLGKNAFMATDIPTCVLFLQRREDTAWVDAERSAASSGIEKAGWMAVAFRTLLVDETTIVTKMGDNQDEKNFLGYHFSNRRGQEGITVYGRSSLVISPVAAANLLKAGLTTPPLYLADFIRASFGGEHVADLLNAQEAVLAAFPEAIRLDLEPLHAGTHAVPTESLLAIADNSVVINPVWENSTPGEVLDFTALDLPVQTVGQLIKATHLTVNSGKRPEGGVKRIRNGVLSLGGEHIDEQKGRLTVENAMYVPQDFYDDERWVKAHVELSDVLVCKDGVRSGKLAIATSDILTTQKPHSTPVPVPAMVNEHVFLVRVTDTDPSVLLPEYLFLYWLSKEGRAEMGRSVSRSSVPGISQARLAKVRVVIPALATQVAFIAKANAASVEQGFSFIDTLNAVTAGDLISE